VSGDPAQLLTEINTTLSRRPISPSTVLSQVAWVRSAAGSPIGQTVVYPVPFIGNKWKVQSLYEEVGGTLPEQVKFQHTIQMWGPDPVLIPKLTQLTDIYGILEDSAQPLIADAQIELERQLAELIGTGNTGTTVYDGKAFFATNKEANPNRPGLATFSNYRTSFDCNAANIATVLDDLDARPGPTGGLFGAAGQDYIIVSTGAQEKVAREALNGQISAVKVASGDTAGVGVSNAGLYGRAKVLKLTQLRNYGSGKLWCAVRVVNEMHRPFACAMAMAPTVYLEGINLSDHSQVTRNVGKTGIKSAHGLGYLWPQLAGLCAES
jgi:hypothetical protein